MRCDTQNENKQKVHADIKAQPFSAFFYCIWDEWFFFVNQGIRIEFRLISIYIQLSGTPWILMQKKYEEWYNQAHGNGNSISFYDTWLKYGLIPSTITKVCIGIYMYFFFVFMLKIIYWVFAPPYKNILSRVKEC